MSIDMCMSPGVSMDVCEAYEDVERSHHHHHCSQLKNDKSTDQGGSAVTAKPNWLLWMSESIAMFMPFDKEKWLIFFPHFWAGCSQFGMQSELNIGMLSKRCKTVHQHLRSISIRVFFVSFARNIAWMLKYAPFMYCDTKQKETAIPSVGIVRIKMNEKKEERKEDKVASVVSATQ